MMQSWTNQCHSTWCLTSVASHLSNWLPKRGTLWWVDNMRGHTWWKPTTKAGDYFTNPNCCDFLWLSQAFQHLVNKRRVFQWSLGPLSSYLYDLTEIDSWADSMSVLELIVGSPKREVQKKIWKVFEENLTMATWEMRNENTIVCSLGERDTWGDSCEAAG